MKQVLIDLLDYLVIVQEIVDTREAKEDAISTQDYEGALKLREKELVLLKDLPRVSDFRAMREELSKL